MAIVLVAPAPFGVFTPIPIVLAIPWVIVTPNGFNAAVLETATTATAVLTS